MHAEAVSPPPVIAPTVSNPVIALNVQIQPGLMTEGDPENLVASLRGAADGTQLQFVEEDRGDDGGPYINLHFSASSPAAGWLRLRGAYDDSALGWQLASSTIVTCEGAHGWDDYLLLHHCDLDEKTDEIDG